MHVTIFLFLVWVEKKSIGVMIFIVYKANLT